jgi:hypothetical protein
MPPTPSGNVAPRLERHKPCGEQSVGTPVCAPAAIPNARKLQRCSHVLDQKSEAATKCSVEAGNDRGVPGRAHAKCRKLAGISHGGQQRYRYELPGTGRMTRAAGSV